MNNRFINPEMASKNTILPPTNFLKFFNTPLGLESGDVENLLKEYGSPKPKCLKVFPAKTMRSTYIHNQTQCFHRRTFLKILF